MWRVVALLVTICVLHTNGQRLVGRVTSRRFERNMTAVPDGAASLAFVFDVTGSMWDDLRQVIAGARQILKTTLNRQEIPLYDFVLIPFHDPNVGPITVTTDPKKFQRQLQRLYVQGGGDCPEMSITAISEALKISLPGSFLYVFTDARSKDHDRLDEVLKIIQRKQSQVVFVLTGDCGERTSPGYKAYEKIASTSSGQVFVITKSDVSEVVKFIEVSVQAHKVLLHATDHPEGGSHSWDIPFDPELREITISISGENRRLELYDPNGRRMTSVDGLETLLELEQVLIVNLKSPNPGVWRVVAESTKEHSLRVSGLSKLDFHARFSRKPTLNWKQTDYQPIEGGQTHMLLNATGLAPPGQFRKFRLLNISGDIIRDQPLPTPPDPAQPTLYAAEPPIVTPDYDFYVTVLGVTHEGYPFVRSTKNAILNIEAVAPAVFMEPSYPGYFDYPAEIPCKVTSLLPFTVEWGRQIHGDWVSLGASNYYEESDTDYLRIDDVTEESEGVYRCIARSTKGTGYAQTFFDVEERPPIVTVPYNVTVPPGTDAILTCLVKSKIKYVVQWRRSDGKSFDAFRGRLMPNNSLMITNTRVGDEGGYICEASNGGGTSSGVVVLTLMEAPTVDISPKDPYKYVTGDRLWMRCKASGFPDPVITWRKGNVVLEEGESISHDSRLHRNNSVLKVWNAEQDDDGVYTCTATNKAGTAVGSARMVYTESPTATIQEDDVLILEGLTKTLRCDITGVPKPRVIWLRDGVQLTFGSRYQLQSDSNLHFNEIRAGDDGNYTCIAKNEIGQDTDFVIMRVGRIPILTTVPADIGIDIGQDGYMPCVAEGYPHPEITWTYSRDGVTEVPLGSDGSRIFHDEDTNSLNIFQVEMRDAGVYRCTAYNEFGSDSEGGRVTITGLVPPHIFSDNLHPHVIEGQSISIPCPITAGNPLPTRQWLRQGTQFSPYGRVEIDNEGSVMITNARTSDAGVYICSASNVVGSFDKEFDLDVWVAPEIINFRNRYTTIEERPVQLSCQATGNPEATIEWTKEGMSVALRYSPHYTVMDDGTLVINNPSQQHTGVYTCTATNPAGEDSKDAYLKVYYKPRTSSDAVDLYTVVEGDSVTMKCPVTRSDPPPTFKWKRNGHTLLEVPGRYDILEDGSLKIFTTRLADDGEYTCTATNEAGSVSHDMDLVVHVPPVIFPGPDVVRGMDGEDMVLHCDASGVPTPTIVWQYVDIEIKTKGRFQVIDGEIPGSSELFIKPARLVDDGVYRCIAENVAGSDYHDTKVDVQIRPSIGPNDRDRYTPSTGDTLSIPCAAFGDPKPIIRWYKAGEELTGSELDVDILADGTLVLLSVDQDDTADYTCEAENEHGISKIKSTVVVYEAPEIINNGDITQIWVLEGEPAEMECIANAVPKPTIQWYKVTSFDSLLDLEAGRIEVESDGEYLQFRRTILSDTGRYRCKAINEEGSSSKLFDLGVYRLPSIDGGDELDRIKVIQGDDIVLDCPATGIPLPTIIWYKGGVQIREFNDQVSLDNLGKRLTIHNADLEHDGNYQCRATNDFGEDDKDFNVAVLVPPTIIGEGQLHDVLVTTKFTLQCIAEGIPDPHTTWFKDNIKIDFGTHPGIQILNRGSELEFATILVDHEGVYKCIAENEAGSDSKEDTVNVQVPPEISSDFGHPEEIDVIKGDNATIYCDANGDPPPTITWYKDGNDVTNSGRYLISQDGSALTIINAKESDAGDFLCSAENDVGIITQETHVNVLVPPSIIGDDEVFTITKGDTKRLECRVTGNPSPQIRWYQYGIPIVEDDTFSMSAGGQFLVIQDAQEKDDAEYMCDAVNTVGKDEKDFRVYVNVPPSIHDFSENSYSVIEGNKISIKCVADGIPPPKYSWLKDGQLVERSSNFKFQQNHQVLVLMQASVRNHEGVYTCVAINDAGTDEKDTQVTVLIPPSIEGQNTTVSTTVIQSDLLNLECRVTRGKPQPVVRWYTGAGELISKGSSLWRNSGQDQFLSNTRVQLGNAGKHWCEATNIAGKAQKNFDVDVQVPPEIEGPEIEDKTVVLGQSSTFECKVSGIPKPMVVWFKDGTLLSTIGDARYVEDEEKSGLHTLTVTHASDSDQATYMCVATNPAASESKEINLNVYLPPSYDGSGITNITILEGQNTDLFCEVNAFPRPTIWWYKDGRPVVLEEETLDDRNLPVRDAKLSDSGLYKCHAENVAGDIERLFRLNVHSLPTIDGPPTIELIKLVGDQVDMECSAQGVPQPQISWTKNGVPITSESDGYRLMSKSQILRIQKATLDNTAAYVCHAQNVEGTDSKLYDLTIHEPPSIAGPEIEHLNVNLNDGFVLNCDVSGTPTPSIKWFKDGRRVYDGFSLGISEDGMQLTVRDSQLSDDGSYICNASNVQAYDTKEFDVNIRVPPSIGANEDNIWVQEGRNLNLSCNVRSNSVVDIKWKKDGVVIQPSAKAMPILNGRRLMLFDMRRRDAAAYTCVATNAAGDAEQTTNVDVYTTPVITNGDETQILNVVQSESITLECIVTGYPTPKIEWLKDYTKIRFDEDGSSADERFSIQRKGRFLTISNAQVYDEGEYVCRATNDAGVDSADHVVNVWVPPTINRNRLRQDITTREKSYVRVQCLASGYPVPTVQWLKDGEYFSENDALKANGNYIDQENYLMFFEILEEEAGRYTCVATNEAGRDEEDVNINVNVPPKLAGEDEYIEKVRGETLEIRCEVERGIPEPAIEWWKRSSKLRDSNRVSILSNGHLLRIAPVQTDDYGTFTCVAKNVEGSDRRRTTVTVLEPPEFDNSDGTNEMDVILGFSRYLTCDIHAEPPPVLQWFKDGTKVTTSADRTIDRDGHILYIHSAREEDDGFYTCRATNKAGSDDQTTKLNVLIPPEIKNDGSDNNIDVKEGNSTSLNCLVDGYPEPTVQWFKNGQRINFRNPDIFLSENQQILGIRNAKVSDAARYSCQVKNKAGSDSKFFRVNVQVAPTIAGPPISTVTMIQGRSYELDCYSDGTPDPTNSWTKDDGPLARSYSLLSSEQRLQVYRATELDNGMFQCTATNVAGQAVKTFNVVVHLSPTFTDPSKFNDLVVNQGDSILLDCTSSTFPTPVVEWRKNGELIASSDSNEVADERVHLDASGFVLVVSDAQKDDASQYSCDLINDAGENSKNFNVDVNTPPEIFGPESEKVIKTLGSSFSLDCEVQGSPTPQVIWLKAGKHIEFNDDVYPVEGRNTLRIENAKREDTGLYSCVASNVAGEDRKDFDVEIQVQPTIDDSGPSNIDVVIGDTFALSCPVDGIPPPVITWYKDGKVIDPDDPGPSTAISPSGEELIVLQAEYPGGRYTCEATNDVGRDDKSFNVNTLIPPALGLRDSSNHVEVNETYTAVLDCDIMGGYPAPEITWKHDGSPVSFSKRIKSFEGGRRLEIYRSRTSDTGTYTCTATNEAGTVSDNVELDVYVPPRFQDDYPENIVVLEGDDVELDCTVYGVPEPAMSWIKTSDDLTGEILLAGEVEFSDDEEHVYLSNVTTDDTAIYTCIASSISGNAQKTFNLTVMVPPKITTPNKLTEVRVVEGDAFNLDCPAEGVPFPTISWLKNGKPLPQLDLNRVRHDGQQFHVESAELSDVGSYSCVAQSPAGEDSRDFDVDVYVPPSADEEGNDITAVVGSDVLLQCTSNAVPPPTFQWFKNGVAIAQTERTFLLQNVQLDDEAVYTCQATNEAGTSSEDTKLTVYEKPSILATPEEYVVQIHEDIELLCFVNGVPKPVVTWWKDNVEITEATHPRFEQVEDALWVKQSQLNDAGKFMCLASNDAGSARKEMTLAVHEHPYIAQGDTNITVFANQPVTLPCEVSGTPKPNVIWTKEGFGTYDINGKIGYRRTEGGSIDISAASVSDSGLYRCLAENEAGSVFKDIQLDVIVGPSIVEGKQRYIVEPGASLEIPCEASGVPEPAVVWDKDGTAAENLQGIRVLGSKNILTIDSVKLEHEGFYRCMAVNIAGLTTYIPQVLVRKAPVVTTSQDTIYALEGTSVKIPCDVEGTPTPTVKWRRGPNEIDFDDIRFTQMYNNALRISTLELSDTAAYTCVAQNSAGTAFGKTRLEVQVMPEIFSELPEEVIAIAGQPFTFPVATTGVPTPTNNWFKDDVILLSHGSGSHYIVQDGGSLHIPIVAATDEGLYKLVTKNAAGEAVLSVFMKVHLPPTITPVQSTNITVIQGNQIPLDVSVDGEPLPVTSWTKDGLPLSDLDRRIQFMTFGSVFINNATGSDAGKYVATAINEAGRDSVEFTVTVYTPPVFTQVPYDVNLETGDALELVCSASGLPMPEIMWMFNGVEDQSLSAEVDFPGTSRLVIKNVRNADSGTYACKAFNVAGSKVASAFVTVGTAPVFTNDHEPVVVVNLDDTAWIDCEVSASPKPSIRWTKDGQEITLGRRFEQLENGTLKIYNAKKTDKADYRCIATNDAGSVDRTSKLVVQSAPIIVVAPEDTIVLSGDAVTLHCVAEGVPEPTIEWSKNGNAIPDNGRFQKLLDNSLHIVASQLRDTAEYECLASNFLGSKLSTAQVTVQVNGGYSEWNSWGGCSVSCGTGHQMRVRFCNSPAPANGGLNCLDPSEEKKSCSQSPCAVNGGWSEYSDWDACTVTCGQGTQTRSRECNNPPPKFGGLKCQGSEFDQKVCRKDKCIVSGGWSDWSSWAECSVSCDNGIQSRTRTCTNPPPSPGGGTCKGRSKTTRICSTQPCPVRGNWGDWASWSFCAVSCGGGTKTRVRFCNNPAPLHGGEVCSGSHIQTDNCNPEPCALDGNWAEWGQWGSCPRSCGSGMRTRYRQCSNPMPKHGGKFCPGKNSEMTACELPPCPIDGNWAGWSDWGLCSVTCGEGTQTRKRSCTNPPPSNEGVWCQGDPTQTTKCGSTSCHLRPTLGKGILYGNVNGIPVGKSDILAHSTDIGDNKTRINAVIKNIPNELGPLLQNQVSILTPIFWTLAREVNGAYNGYSLTKAEFTRQVMVEFITGERVYMNHVAKGLDPEDGSVVMEAEITGEVPTFPPINLELKDYSEDYVQTGLGSLYAYSDRFFKIDDILMLYSWNHSIQYDPINGRMPYLVETLEASRIQTEFDPREQELILQLDVSIGAGYPSDECPPGFVLDESGLYCNDDDECQQDICSHTCYNSMGSFVCGCPVGLRISYDGVTCQDIDECAENKITCEPPTQCVNNQGSYRCEVICSEGYLQSTDGVTCSDIDECSISGERYCEHICYNTPGSYMCSCRTGYKSVGKSRCEDIDECEEGACHGSVKDCINTPGSYTCLNECASGYEMVGGQCVDVDECANPDLNICDQGCKNVEGSYRCLCQEGFIRNSLLRQCEDIDECEVSDKTCQYKCTNTIGSFKCYCPPGYRVSKNGRTCDDINECIEGEPKCVSADAMCANTFGTYKCVNSRCPEPYIRRNGACVRECLSGDCPQKYKHFLRFNSTFVRVGLQAGEPLLTLYVSYVNSEGFHELHRNTRFEILTPAYVRSAQLFGIRSENEERGIIYVKTKLVRKHINWYKLRVRANSSKFDGSIEYETIFNLYINVAPNPFEQR